MDDSGRIYFSENPNPADVSRLDGFVKALKEAGHVKPEATTEEAVAAIESLRSQVLLDRQRSINRANTIGAFGAARK